MRFLYFMHYAFDISSGLVDGNLWATIVDVSYYAWNRWYEKYIQHET